MPIAPAILLLLTLYPQLDRPAPDKDAIKKWKPGPRVSQEIARLEKEGRDLYRAFREGKLAQLKVIREHARIRTMIDQLRELAFGNRSDEVPNLVVVIDSDEYWQIFPHGMKHLPGGLSPGGIYAASPGSSQYWQFLGERRTTGMRLSVFRSAASDVSLSTQKPE
jgi:hypothetical protein